jgi:hypothetical protein
MDVFHSCVDFLPTEISIFKPVFEPVLFIPQHLLERELAAYIYSAGRSKRPAMAPASIYPLDYSRESSTIPRNGGGN